MTDRRTLLFLNDFIFVGRCDEGNITMEYTCSLSFLASSVQWDKYEERKLKE
jgi:hypothetical protein